MPGASWEGVFRDTLIGCSVPLETTAAHDQRLPRERAASLAKGNQRREEKEGAMPERPSLEAQIDDDEAWLAANDDDDWDAPAAPPAPAAAPEPAPAAEAAPAAGRGAAPGEHDDEAQRTVDTTLAAAQVCVYDLEGDSWRPLAGGRWVDLCLVEERDSGQLRVAAPDPEGDELAVAFDLERDATLALHEVQGKPSSFAELARGSATDDAVLGLRFVDATAAQAFDRALQSALRRVSSCAPPQELLDGVEPRTSFDTALKQLKAMGFDETSIRRAHGALQVADAGLLAEWMLERPENEEPEAQPPSALTKGQVSDIPWDDVEASALRILAQSQNSPIPERLKHASKAATRHCKELSGRMATTPGGTRRARPRRRCCRCASTPARRRRGAAHAVSSHLREVLDKIAVEDQPMSPLTDDAGVEEEKNEESPERQLASPGASRRVSMASPVVSPAPAPAPRPRGTLGLDGNTPVKPPPQKRKSAAAGRLAAMFKSPAKEKKKTSRAPLPAVPTPPSIRAARRADYHRRPLEVGRIARYPTTLFSVAISRPRGLLGAAPSALWS